MIKKADHLDCFTNWSKKFLLQDFYTWYKNLILLHESMVHNKIRVDQSKVKNFSLNQYYLKDQVSLETQTPYIKQFYQ